MFGDENSLARSQTFAICVVKNSEHTQCNIIMCAHAWCFLSPGVTVTSLTKRLCEPKPLGTRRCSKKTLELIS